MDFERAMAEIGDIRLQMSRTRIFRGFTTSTTLCTAGAAVAAAAFQASFVGHAGSDPVRYAEYWMCVAALCLFLASAEVARRFRRTDSTLERELTLSVAEHLLPFLLVSGLVTSVICLYASKATWVLPGLWQAFFGLGLIQLRKFLPWMVVLVGAFYILCGLVNLSAGESPGAFAAWRMGVPFGMGQATAAWIVRWGREDGYEA
jgi:hypothetical protein